MSPTPPTMPAEVEAARKVVRKCAFEGCTRDAHSRGVCGPHYQQVRSLDVMPENGPVDPSLLHPLASAAVAKADEDGILDESIEACRILGIDRTQDYNYIETLREVTVRAGLLRSVQHTLGVRQDGTGDTMGAVLALQRQISRSNEALQAIYEESSDGGSVSEAAVALGHPVDTDDLKRRDDRPALRAQIDDLRERVESLQSARDLAQQDADRMHDIAAVLTVERDDFREQVRALSSTVRAVAAPSAIPTQPGELSYVARRAIQHALTELREWTTDSGDLTGLVTTIEMTAILLGMDLDAGTP